MNIWIFNQYAITPDMPGGTRHYDLGRELVRRGHNIVILATSFHHQMHKETKLEPGKKWDVGEVDGINFVWLKTPGYFRNDWRRVVNMIVYAWRAWGFGRKLLKLIPSIDKPDVIFGSSPHLLIPLAAYFVSKHYDVPFLMEVRDLWPQTLIDMEGLSEKSPITKILQILEKFLYKKANLVITLLPKASDYITKCGISEKKIIWIPNGVDLSRFSKAEPSSLSGKKEFKVMYLGAHGRANALDVIIKASKIIQDRGFLDIKFILIGDGPEKPRLIALSKDINLCNMEFWDPVPKIRVPDVLCATDATVFILHDISLYKYGISLNKLFDYLAAGKPLVLVGNPSNNPIKEIHCGINIPSGNPEVFADAIVKLYNMSAEERREMGRRGREYVEKYHDIKKLAKKLEDVIYQVVNG